MKNHAKLSKIFHKTQKNAIFLQIQLQLYGLNLFFEVVDGVD